MRDWYIYVDKTILQVCRVSPTLEEDEQCYVHPIPQELGISFVEAPHTLNDYVVFQDGDKIHFIKKEKSSQVFVPFYYTPAIINEKVENPDILVSVNRKAKTLTFQFKKEKASYGLSIYASLTKEKQKAPFYVSKRNDPNYLLETIHVDMLKLINQGSLEVPFNHDIKKTSIFTRKVFDTYGLEIK